MNVISKINQTENVAVVSLDKAPSDIRFLNKLFCSVSEKGINIDMISQTAPKGNKISLSFTIDEKDMAELLSVLTKLDIKGMITSVSAGNAKLSLYGKEMPCRVGVAADVFSCLFENNIDVLLITTSEVDISMALASSNVDKACRVLKEKYSIE